MYSLNTKIERLAGVGPSLKKTLNNLGLFYIEDLFYHLPFRYIDFSKKVPIGKAEVEQMVTIQAQIISINARRSFRSKLQLTEAILEDSTGQIKIVWFNQPYLAQQLSVGDELIVAGKIEWFKEKQLTNPFYEKVDNSLHATGKILPIYHLTKGLSNLRLAKLIKLAWNGVEFNTDDSEDKIFKKYKLLNLQKALQTLHFPSDSKQIEQARLRIAIEDCLPQQIAVAIKREALNSSQAPVIKTDIEFIKGFLETLPFQLTASQKRATWDILQALSEGKPHSQLLEGDVGSGKTVVAMLVSLMVAKSGYQTVLLAPTEILARQHYETFLKLVPKSSGVGLLTRSFSEIDGVKISKQELYEQLSNSELKIIIGTHAILSDKLHFSKLGFVIIDEQHRFGVGQRAYLHKQHGTDLVPHLLSMTATPIPRSLALSLFGNLEISQLTQMPKNRQVVKTQLLSEQDRAVAYNKIRSEIKAGRQAFVITPKVEESDDEVKSVKLEFSNLQRLFPDCKLGLVYGSMKSSEKDEVMSEFSSGKIDILVATTVIEIGIDVPNSTVILIEGAENFGLAQLHQLRGRVGRGQHQSYCFLFTTREDQMETSRLKIFETTTDGFALAEHDLKERGFGDLFGKQQSGFSFRFPQFLTIPALKTARLIAEDLIANNPNLIGFDDLHNKAKAYLEEIHSE